MKILTMVFGVFLTLFLFIQCSEESAIQEVDPIETDNVYLQVYPIATSNYTFSFFGLYLPEIEGNYRGIMVLVPGYNGDGTTYLAFSTLRDFVQEEKLALLTCYYIGDDSHEYYHADGGSGAALLRCIDELSNRTEVDYLRDLPLILWGHSAGGMFSQSFAVWKPEMVAGINATRSADFVDVPSDSAKNIPSLFLLGQYDDRYWNESCLEFVKQYRSEGALWGHAIEPEIGHNIGRSFEISFPFMSSIIQHRIGTSISHYNELLPMTEEDGWLGDNDSLDIFRHDEYEGNYLNASWLIDETVANEWYDYVNGNFDEEE